MRKLRYREVTQLVNKSPDLNACSLTALSSLPLPDEVKTRNAV